MPARAGVHYGSIVHVEARGVAVVARGQNLKKGYHFVRNMASSRARHEYKNFMNTTDAVSTREGRERHTVDPNNGTAAKNQTSWAYPRTRHCQEYKWVEHSSYDAACRRDPGICRDALDVTFFHGHPFKLHHTASRGRARECSA